MEGLELGTVVLVSSLVLAALALAGHRHRRPSAPAPRLRAPAGVRRKEKIQPLSRRPAAGRPREKVFDGRPKIF